MIESENENESRKECEKSLLANCEMPEADRQMINIKYW